MKTRTILGLVIATVVAVTVALSIQYVGARDFGENDGRMQSIKYDTSKGKEFTVVAFCEDKVVCYGVSNYRGGHGSCFRDQDLVDKYCK